MRTQTQQRVARVLENMMALNRSSKVDAAHFVNSLDDMLDEIRSNDGFGTEAQRDPRGDGRDDRWNMRHVEGVDDTMENDDLGKTQQRVLLVLERIQAQARTDEYTAGQYFDVLDYMFDELRDDDFFGMGGFNDPRGDATQGAWSMSHVQGHVLNDSRDADEEPTDAYKQIAVDLVMDRMIALARSSLQDAVAFASSMDDMLDEIRSEDGFGSEAQTDPRGDGRDGEWSMRCVEGIDRLDEDGAEPDDRMQMRVGRVLERMLAMTREDPDDAAMLASSLTDMLDELHEAGVFGEDGHRDPRGDFRKDAWTMGYVQGIDTPA